MTLAHSQKRDPPAHHPCNHYSQDRSQCAVVPGAVRAVRLLRDWIEDVDLSGGEHIEKDVQQDTDADPPEARVDVVRDQGGSGCEKDVVEAAAVREQPARIDVRQVASDKDEQQGERVVQAICEVAADDQRGEDVVLAVN